MDSIFINYVQVGYGLMMGKNDSNKVIGIDLFAAEGFDKDTRHYAIFSIISF